MRAVVAYSIRPYQPDDLDALIALFRDSVRRDSHPYYTYEQRLAWAPDTIDRDAWAVARASRPTWVATLEEHPVGFADLMADDHIDMLFVHPDHQGRGIATALLDLVEREAHGRHAARVTVDASLNARALFEGRGYRVLTRQTISRHGQQLVNFRMAKPLPGDQAI